MRVAVPAALLLAALASPTLADEPRPGSVLVFPGFHSSSTRATLVSVTNTSPSTPVRALFRYVSSGPELKSPDPHRDCSELYRAESLTPADTVTVLTSCHTGSSDDHGYLVVTAQDASGGFPVAHDHLVGSALLLDFGLGFGGFCSYLPASYEAPGAPGSPTDVDLDGRLDFDGIEYERLPDDLFLDSFIGVAGSRLSLLNLSGDRNATVSVQLAVWNDAEKAFSAQLSFRCWFETSLTDVSAIFSEAFLAANTPNDPGEIDSDCDGDDDLEAGWARVSGIVASGSFQSVSNPPLLGMLGGGKQTFEPGRLLWGSDARSAGSF